MAFALPQRPPSPLLLFSDNSERHQNLPPSQLRPTTCYEDPINLPILKHLAFSYHNWPTMVVMEQPIRVARHLAESCGFLQNEGGCSRSNAAWNVYICPSSAPILDSFHHHLFFVVTFLCFHPEHLLFLDTFVIHHGTSTLYRGSNPILLQPG